MQTLEFSVSGVRCGGCIRSVTKLFSQYDDAVRIEVNLSKSTMKLRVGPKFDVVAFAKAAKAQGYLLGASEKLPVSAATNLQYKMGITLALAGNIMMFAAADYFGLVDASFLRIFHATQWGLLTVVVLVGADTFVRPAMTSLSRGLFHMDLPISAGIVAAYVAITTNYFRNGSIDYADGLGVFVALMIVGRFVVSRQQERARAQLQATPKLDALLVRKWKEGRWQWQPVSTLLSGDRMLLEKNQVVPCASSLLQSHCDVSLAWINGEHASVGMKLEDRVPAGAMLVSDTAELVTTEAFGDSRLHQLLGEPRDGLDSAWWNRVSRVYAIVTVLLGLFGFAIWCALASFETGIAVATSVWVVACPCALGFGAPLAHALAAVRLGRHGVLVRNPVALERIPSVEEIAFDKTGTLTDGLRLRSEVHLSNEEKQILRALAVRSSHPKSIAIASSIVAKPLDSIKVTEHVGCGVETLFEGYTYRLGKSQWARGSSAHEGTVFTQDSELLEAFVFDESVRVGSTVTLDELKRQKHDLWVLSGDQQDAVHEVARELAIRAENALGEQSPEQKQAWVVAHPRALFVGDGVNDAAGLRSAWVSVAASVEQPLAATRADLFLTDSGLESIGAIFSTAVALRKVLRQTLALSVSYNLICVSLALAGVMTPWLAAVLMPLSSVITILMTKHGMTEPRQSAQLSLSVAT